MKSFKFWRFEIQIGKDPQFGLFKLKHRLNLVTIIFYYWSEKEIR